MRVVIAEDEALLREGLSLLLSSSGLDVVGLANDADQLVSMVGSLRPDVVVTDIRMPPTSTDDGLRAAIAIRAELPGTAVMVLSQFVQQSYALELLADDPSGVGYLLKQRVADVEQFSDDVRRVGEGGTVIDPDVVASMATRANVQRGSLDVLTPRQRDVLALIAEGRTNAAIAARLGITEKAVVMHSSNVYMQLGLPVSPDDHRRVLAVVRYLSASGSSQQF